MIQTTPVKATSRTLCACRICVQSMDTLQMKGASLSRHILHDTRVDSSAKSGKLAESFVGNVCFDPQQKHCMSESGWVISTTWAFRLRVPPRAPSRLALASMGEDNDSGASPLHIGLRFPQRAGITVWPRAALNRVEGAGEGVGHIGQGGVAGGS
jgi:hypothetical protein